mmetsp:Transcript_23015/g.32968  ORF Transcript_23015/g.32968 Transcript_23015/m.32968 type:complete len:585 (+) Transcript_23015:80-1834(+)
MSGNGGQPSPLKAATTGRLPPDRGRKVLQNPMDDTMEEELLDEMAQDSNNLEFQDRTESWDEEDLYYEAEAEIEQGGFSAAVNSVLPVGIANAARPIDSSLRNPIFSGRQIKFPMGVNHPRTSLNTTRPSPHVTPQATSAKRAGRRPSEDASTEEVEIISASDRNGVTIQSNAFRRASSMTNQKKKVLKLLPEKVQPELASLKTYNYVAELQFNKPLLAKGVKLDNSKEYNVPMCLAQWIRKTREIAPDIILHPYRVESGGNPITHEEQLPEDDSDAINLYFHNHRVDNNGILKGMLRFSASVPWMTLKDQRRPYFKWLSQNRVFLRHTNFDADSLVLLGYLQGSHPDASRLVDMTGELKERLNLPEGIDFQLSPRNLSVLDSQATNTKFGFKAIAVETDIKMAGELREAFFRLGDPKVAKHKWPVTGTCLFVPMYAGHAKTFFGQLQQHLRAVLSAEDLHTITQGKVIQLTDRVSESSVSKIYAGYAEAMLRENPQDGFPLTASVIGSPQRKKTRMEISYSTMAKRALETSRGRSTSPVEADTAHEWEEAGDWEKKIEASFTRLFGDQPPLRAEDVQTNAGGN